MTTVMTAAPVPLLMIASFATGIVAAFFATFMLIRFSDRDGGKE